MPLLVTKPLGCSCGHLHETGLSIAHNLFNLTPYLDLAWHFYPMILWGYYEWERILKFS